MIADRKRIREVVGAEWYDACQPSIIAYVKTRWRHRKGRVPALPASEAQITRFIKEYAAGRAWYELMTLFDANYDVLFDHPVAMAYTFVAYIRLGDEERLQEMIRCVQGSSNEAWIISRAIDCVIMCGYLERIMQSETLLSHVRGRHRQKWIASLWDICGDEYALSELKHVPIEQMSVEERRVWMRMLIKNGELTAAETMLGNFPDKMTYAALLQKQRKFAEAARLYQELAMSDNANERRFGEEGVSKLKRFVGI